MKIAYLTHQFLPGHIGGVEIYTWGLARRARQAGHAAHVITYCESPSGSRADHGRRRAAFDDIPVTEIHDNLSLAPNRARVEYDNAFAAAEVRAELLALRPDLVHVTHAMKLSASVLQVCHDLGLPVVITLADFWFLCLRHTLLRSNGRLCGGPRHALDCTRCFVATHSPPHSPTYDLPEPLLWAKMGAGLLLGRTGPFWDSGRAITQRKAHLRRLVCRAERVIALSQFQKRVFVRNGYPARKIDVLPHGLETEHLPPVGAPPSALTLITIASIVPHKGLHVLLEAMRRCPQLDLRLLIYGSLDPPTPYSEQVQALARDDARVSWMGTFPPHELGRVLAGASALALPALWYENEPLVVKAALYLGIPVLASRIGSLTEMIDAAGQGWLLPPGDPAAWAEALRALPGRDFSRRAPAAIPSMDENARQMFAIYESVLASRGGSATRPGSHPAAR